MEAGLWRSHFIGIGRRDGGDDIGRQESGFHQVQAVVLGVFEDRGVGRGQPGRRKVIAGAPSLVLEIMDGKKRAERRADGR